MIDHTASADQSAISNEPDVVVRVSVSDQKLTVIRFGQVLAEFAVSTSRFGLGTEPGSLKTPLGRFRVFQKVGDGAPPGAIFKSRQFTGEIATGGGDEDLILSRILWLEGCEAENAGTRDRYIYLHGTNQEALIGTPASHGCVRLRNCDIIKLYDLVPRGSAVEIVA